MGILLLVLGFVGIITILFTRFYWLGSLMTIAAFIAYFVLFGTGQWLYLIVLLLGLSLMGLELIIPSFGAIGIVGILMIGVGLYMSSVEPIATLFNFSIAFVLALTTIVVLMKQGARLQLTKGLVLKEQLSSSDAYTTSSINYQQFLNQVGMSLTSLRPVGKARFGNQDIEVITSGEMIDVYERIVVYKVEGNKLIVRRDLHG